MTGGPAALPPDRRPCTRCNFAVNVRVRPWRAGKGPPSPNAEAVESPQTLSHERPSGAPATSLTRRLPRSLWRRPPSEARLPAVDPPVPRGELLLGRYRLLERLGAGGFGVVWRARDEVLQRQLAIKRVEHAHTGDRAHREALATARLAHPAIAALHEARAEGDSLYLISELVPGAPLHRLLAVRALDDHRVLEIGVALSEALEHAHACGVVHRDVKPANVIVLPDADASREHIPAKLTDFGSARIAGEDALTHTGDILGTLAYMAPEQSEGLEATSESDLYALALVLYEALSGVNPQRGATPAATARRLGTSVPPLADYRPDLPAVLRAAIDRALLPRGEERGTLGELRQVLRGACEPRIGWRKARRAATAIFPAERTLPRERPPRVQLERTLVGGEALPTRDGQPLHLAAAAPGRRRFGVARTYWWAGALAAIAWQALAGHGGVALVLAAFAAPLIALPRRAGPGWLIAALAPALGAVGLAGAYPAIAGQATNLRARAGLGALGYWWLLLAEMLTGHRLWLWPQGAGHALATNAWSTSAGAAATYVLRPLISVATIEGAALWALGAASLPWVVRGRSAVRDVVGATIWAAALVSAEPIFDRGLGVHAAGPSPRGALLAGILCATLAVCARALRGPVSRPFRIEGRVT